MDALRVLIAGGGIAAAEALLALDDLAGDRVGVELIAPGEVFIYRPHLVAEPFSLGPAARIELDRLAREHHADHRRDALASVDPGARSIRTASGASLDYDALLIATGARPVAAVEGALDFGQGSGRDAFRALLRELETATRKRLAFAVPAGVRWSLPAYELALLSAAHLRARGVSTVEISVATHERRPLELLGDSAPEIVGELLAQAGIELRAQGAPVRFDRPVLELADGARMDADHVVALPALEIPQIDGIPQRSRGFIPTDVRLNVEGLTTVWAAGDVTWFPVKQGGLAAQQADVAADRSPRERGPGPDLELPAGPARGDAHRGPAPLLPRRAVRRLDDAASPTALWSPPLKLAGRYLELLSQRRPAGTTHGELADLEPPAERGAEADREDHLRYELDFAVAAADADARKGDYDGALDWLDVVEEMTLVLPPAYLERRESWRRSGRRA